MEEIKIQNLDVSELLNYMDTLINDKNPYNVNRKMDSLKAIFYQKINKKDNIKSSEEKDFEIKFKAYKKKKFEYRKKQEKEENKNFNNKKNIIEEIYNITKEKESLKETFNGFIDESYDSVEEIDKRFALIEKEIEKISKMSKQEIHDWYWSMEEIYK